MKVGDIMTSGAELISPDATLHDAAKRMAECFRSARTIALLG